MYPLKICIDPTIRIGRESWCLLYAGFFSLSFNKIGQSSGASRWRVCYQRGLPRLV